MAVIDGTGPSNELEYLSGMQNSFCRQLGARLAPNAFYHRGPSGFGLETFGLAAWAADALSCVATNRLFIAGYSRGGSAAVIAADLLRTRGLKVEAIFLFDPVARHMSSDTATIPGNVGSAWIARRRIDDRAMDKYDWSLKLDPAGHNPARNWFGTTAQYAAPNVKMRHTTVLGSHGALGGVGWKHVSEDPGCQSRVAGWMNNALSHHGLGNGLLMSIPP
jgi:pimeloyl-ACP methyl ester carboxylesterase